MINDEKIIEQIKRDPRKQYEENANLQEKFSTLDDFLKSITEKTYYEIQFKKKTDFQSEFGTIERYVTFKVPEENENIGNIIGGKIIR